MQWKFSSYIKVNKERGQILQAKSYEFIPLFMTKVAKSDKGISSNPSLLGVYDLYRYEDTAQGRISSSLGIYPGGSDNSFNENLGIKDPPLELGAKYCSSLFEVNSSTFNNLPLISLGAVLKSRCNWFNKPKYFWGVSSK